MTEGGYNECPFSRILSNLSVRCIDCNNKHTDAHALISRHIEIIHHHITKTAILQCSTIHGGNNQGICHGSDFLQRSEITFSNGDEILPSTRAPVLVREW